MPTIWTKVMSMYRAVWVIVEWCACEIDLKVWLVREVIAWRYYVNATRNA
jgi:hypothetical protein